MSIIPPTKEDRVKALMYAGISREKGLEEISTYTRECIKRYDEQHMGKLGLRLANSFSLIDVLMQIAEEARSIPAENKFFRKFKSSGKKKTRSSYDNYDVKAFAMIRRCCRGFKNDALEYYRFYRNMKEHGYGINFYIGYQEENIPMPIDAEPSKII